MFFVVTAISVVVDAVGSVSTCLLLFWLMLLSDYLVAFAADVFAVVVVVVVVVASAVTLPAAVVDVVILLMLLIILCCHSYSGVLWFAIVIVQCCSCSC